jgi:hypothetical protein
MNRCYQCSALTSDECKSESFKGFGLCGKCAIERKRTFGADAQAPRNRSGNLVSASAKSAIAHREDFVVDLRRAAVGIYNTNHEAMWGFRPDHTYSFNIVAEVAA